jgi:hypothetical protein
MKIRIAGTALALAFTAACGGGENASSGQAAAADSAPPAADGGMAGMEGMPGMGGGQQDDMTAQMQAHMQSMRGASGDSLVAMLPMHRQMAANMLARMNREMSQMNMPADAAWTATADSVRQDLTRMPEMDASEAQALMPQHEARLSRLMEMHRSMMGEMKM